MIEQWKWVDGYENMYEISDQGRVRSYKHCSTGRLKSLFVNTKGYLKTGLSKDGIKTNTSVHRLVAQAFIVNENNLPQVNHIDEVKSNNYVSNLEWCTNQHNVEHSNAKNFIFTSPSGETIEVFNLSKFCRENGLGGGNMFNVISGRADHHKGWRNAISL